MLISLPPQSNDPRCSHGYISTMREEWMQVFIVTAEIYVAGTLIYIIWGAGNPQPWAVQREVAVMATKKINDNNETRPLLSESHKQNEAKHSFA